MDSEVPAKPRVAAHVLERVDLNQQRHEGHQPQHRDGQAVDGHAPGDVCAGDAQPVEAKRGRPALEQVAQDVPEQKEPQEDGNDGEE